MCLTIPNKNCGANYFLNPQYVGSTDPLDALISSDSKSLLVRIPSDILVLLSKFLLRHDVRISNGDKSATCLDRTIARRELGQ
jgi:hypothetical protein